MVVDAALPPLSTPYAQPLHSSLQGSRVTRGALAFGPTPVSDAAALPVYSASSSSSSSGSSSSSSAGGVVSSASLAASTPGALAPSWSAPFKWGVSHSSGPPLVPLFGITARDPAASEATLILSKSAHTPHAAAASTGASAPHPHPHPPAAAPIPRCFATPPIASITQCLTASAIAALAVRCPAIGRYLESPRPYLPTTSAGLVGIVGLLLQALDGTGAGAGAGAGASTSTSLPPRQPFSPLPPDAATLHFAAQLASASSAQQAGSLLALHAQVCCEAARMRLGALAVEAAAAGHGGLAVELGGWVHAGVRAAEAAGGEEGEWGGSVPLLHWPLPFGVVDEAAAAVQQAQQAQAQPVLPCPRYTVRRMQGRGGMGVAASAYSCATLLCLQRYCVEGAVASPLGLRLVHPAAVLHLALHAAV